MSKTGKINGYDIQIVDIQPGDTILLHLNDDVDLESANAIVDMMTELYPDCTTIPVNEWFLKGMTIFRQAEKMRQHTLPHFSYRLRKDLQSVH